MTPVATPIRSHAACARRGAIRSSLGAAVCVCAVLLTISAPAGAQPGNTPPPAPALSPPTPELPRKAQGTWLGFLAGVALVAAVIGVNALSGKRTHQD